MTPLFRRGAEAPRRPFAAILIADLLLAGCAGPALDARHRELEQGFAARSGAAAAGAPPAADRDPLATEAQLEREPLVREVLARNPSVEAARQAWRAALERYPQATSLDDPTVGYAVAPRSFGSNAVDPGHRVDLAQRLPFPGKLRLRGEIALADAEAAAGDFEDARLRLAEQASLLFDDYYLASRAIEINAAHLGLLEELRRIATARYATGVGSQQDPLAAELEHARLLHEERSLRTERQVTAARMNALL